MAEGPASKRLALDADLPLDVEDVDLLVSLQAAGLSPVVPVHPPLLWRALR